MASKSPRGYSEEIMVAQPVDPISAAHASGAMSPVAGYGVSVVSIAFSLFMSLLEFLVAFIQAYVFTLLSALYFGAAVEEHH